MKDERINQHDLHGAGAGKYPHLFHRQNIRGIQHPA